MCGIFCSLGTGPHQQILDDILEKLRCRGPDSENTISVERDSPPWHITLCSSVLSLRGSNITTQPYQDAESNYILCWNGEAWSIDRESGIEDDTASVFGLLGRTLRDAGRPNSVSDGLATAKHLANALSRVAGPYAFVFFDRGRERLYFGRDFLGRRSLCWRQSSDDGIVLCSVTDGVRTHEWHEVEADGVYFIDISSLTYAPTAPTQQLGAETALYCIATCMPYSFIGEGSSVVPRLVLNNSTPSTPRPLDERSIAVVHLEARLQASLALRVLNVPDPPKLEQAGSDTKITILFSGGLDCTVLARMCHDILPTQQSIDLLNVAFENPRIHSKLEGGVDAAYELCPDRITGRASFAELQTVCPGRSFRFIAVNIPYSETLEHRETVISLMHPHNTEMDLSISHALYFAARGKGIVLDHVTGLPSEYRSPARVLLSGLGADELFGGYTRHATAFRRAGFAGLIDELELDVSRLGKRNLGRDDRVISHWGKEARFPFLDEALVSWAVNAGVDEKCGFGEPAIDDDAGSAALEPGKKVLRCLAWKLGMKTVAAEKKRAVRQLSTWVIQIREDADEMTIDPIRGANSEDGDGEDERNDSAVMSETLCTSPRERSNVLNTGKHGFFSFLMHDDEGTRSSSCLRYF